MEAKRLTFRKLKKLSVRVKKSVLQILLHKDHLRVVRRLMPFCNSLQRNEREGGGVANVVQVFSDLADFARTNADNAAQGVDLFGEVAKPTRLDLMRRFSDLTGVEIDESKFRPVDDLKDAVKFERASVKEEKIKKIEKATESLKSILSDIKTRLSGKKDGVALADTPSTPFMAISDDLKKVAKDNGYDLESFNSHSFDWNRVAEQEF